MKIIFFFFYKYRCWASEINNPCPGALENTAASRGYTGGFASGKNNSKIFLIYSYKLL